MREVIIPSGLLRNRNAYRTLAGAAGFISCGFFDDARTGAIRDAVSDSYVLVWVLRGAVQLSGAGGVDVRVPAGGCFQRLPGWQHSSVPEDGAYGECWLEAGGAASELLARFGVFDPRRHVLMPGLDLRLVQRLDDFHRRLRDANEIDLPRRLVELMTLIGELCDLDRVRQGDDAHGDLIEQACRMLRGGHAQRGSLERLCREHGLGFERFRKLFTERVGCPLTVYRNRARIDRARELLLDGDDTIADIATQLGWRSATTFSLYFKQAVGEAPAHFRARRRG